MLTKIKSWLVLGSSVLMVTLLPTLGDYLHNSWQVSVQELLIPLLLDLLLALVITSIFYRLWRRNRVAGLVAALVAAGLFGMGYDIRFVSLKPLLSAIWPLPGLGDPGLNAVLVIGIAVGAYWAGRGASNVISRYQRSPLTTAKALIISVSVTFALQFFPTVWNLAAAWPQFFYRPPALPAAPASAKTAEKPDIYYIVMDDYASPEVLKNQFGYDESDFVSFLQSHGFYVPSNPHQNYPYTSMSIASTLSAGYDADMINKFSKAPAQTTVPYNDTIRNAPVIKNLKTLGYSYDLVGNWYETSNISGLANHVYQAEGRLTLANHTMILDNFQKNELTSSVFWRFLQGGAQIGKFHLFGYSNASDSEMTLGQLQYLKELAGQPAGGRFIFAHILVPHEPYYFNADGSINADIYGNDNGKPIKQKYVDQVKYINNQVQSVITQIDQKTDGKAVVVLQSDEGPDPFDLNDKNFDTKDISDNLLTQSMLKLSGLDLQMKYGNQAAYRIPAASQSDLTTGANSVDVFRIVLDRYFNEQLPYLSSGCYYAYPNGRVAPFVYDDVSKQITGQTDPSCIANGTGPKQ